MYTVSLEPLVLMRDLYQNHLGDFFNVDMPDLAPTLKNEMIY